MLSANQSIEIVDDFSVSELAVGALQLLELIYQDLNGGDKTCHSKSSWSRAQ